MVDCGRGGGGLWEGWWCMMGGAVVDSGGRWEGQWWMVGGVVVDGGGWCSHWHIGVHRQVVLGDERLVQGLLRSEARSITQTQEA